MERDDLLSRPPAELADAIGQLHALSTAALAKACEYIWAYDELGAWEDDGATSMTAWLTAALGVNDHTASELARVARALPELPEIRRALFAAELSFDAVRALSKFATPTTDAHLAREARKYTAAQLNRMARRARPLPAEEEAEAHDERSLKLRYDTERHVTWLTGQLPDHQGAIVERALDRAAADAPVDPETGLTQPLDTLMADALVEICSARLAEDPDTDRATVVVHVDGEVLSKHPTDDDVDAADPDPDLPAPGLEAPTDGAITPAGCAELEAGGGRAITFETAMRFACDARWQLVARGSDGATLGIGRLSRTVPPWLTRLLKKRDTTCRFPGCTRRCWLYAHHVHHWAHGGRTDLGNLCLLCFTHHRLVHEGGWRIEGVPEGELVFVRPDGSMLATGPPPLREDIAERFFENGGDVGPGSSGHLNGLHDFVPTTESDVDPDDPPTAVRDGPA